MPNQTYDSISLTAGGVQEPQATSTDSRRASVHVDIQPIPAKRELLGVYITPTNYTDLVHTMMAWCREGRRGIVDFMPVHGLIIAARHDHFRQAMNGFDVIAPDGQPVRWALNLIHKTQLTDRVYGPECMWRLCRAAEAEGVAIYLFGGHADVLAILVEKLNRAFPDLRIAGCESPPFRALTRDEDDAVVHRINASGAGLVFLGIGCPKQEMFAYEHRDSINAIQFCVGAAFDFHAGVKRMAPQWMQNRGLEWLFRLYQEPRRLFRRYAVTNTLYVILIARELLRRAVRSRVPAR